MAMPRTARKRCPEGIHHIIVEGHDHAGIFALREQKTQYLMTIQRYHLQGSVKLYAYCILDNSAHLLIEEITETTSDFMRKTGISYVYWYNRTYHRTGPLFRDRYASEPVPGDAELIRTVRFIHQLPVRYGVAATMEDYPWSSYQAYLAHDFRMDIDLVLGELGEWNYVSYMQNSWKDSFLQEKAKSYRRKKKPALESKMPELAEEQEGMKDED